MIFKKNLTRLLILFSTFFLIASITIFVFNKNTNNVYSYNSNIREKCYFALKGGHVYKLGDTIKISKFATNSNCNFELMNLNTNKKESFKPSKNNCDLSYVKFNSLNNSKVTDYILPKQSGVYTLSLYDGKYVFRDIVVINPENTKPKIKYVLSDYTWIAYNDFGGYSNYRDSITPRYRSTLDKFQDLFLGGYKDKRPHYKLSMYRPNRGNSLEFNWYFEDSLKIKNNRTYHLAVSEIPLLKLIFQDFPNSIEVIDSEQFSKSTIGTKDQLFAFSGHPEYWSERMIGRLISLKKNNNFLFLSGNNIYGQVSQDNDQLTAKGYNCFKELTSNQIGTYFDAKSYLKNSSLQIVDTSHFLFNGLTKLEIGGDFVASHECDRIGKYTKGNTEVIAVGKNVQCDVVLIKNDDHYILNTSSVGSYKGLSEPNFTKFIKNFVELTVK